MRLELISGIIVLVVISLNVLWYYIKYVVHQNGYETHLFSGHFKDIVNLHNLHAREHDPAKKRSFKILLFGFYFGLLLFFIAAGMMFSSAG